MQSVRIYCHSCPEQGHSIPMLRVIEILQKRNPHYDITFFSSKFYVEMKKEEFPNIKMFGIEDGLTKVTYPKRLRT
jgi:UDP:flavonoid glycosyltransferase YjiC (YdhE family)